MVRIIVVQPDDVRVEVELRPGESVMLAAIRADVQGIAADCGGNCACATCHVYVDPAWADKVPPPWEDEEAMLPEVAAERHPNSRLACQLHGTPTLDGLVVHVAPRQH